MVSVGVPGCYFPVFPPKSLWIKDSRFPGWSVYFPLHEFSEEFPYLPQIEGFKAFFRHQATTLLTDLHSTVVPILLDYEHVAGDLQEVHPNFPEDLRNQSDLVVRSMALALHQVALEIQTRAPSQASGLAPTPMAKGDVHLPVFKIRFFNFQPLTLIKELKANFIGKFAAIRGTVVRVGNIKSLVTKMAFQCNRCGCGQTLPFIDGKFEVPSRCDDHDCRSQAFTPLRLSPNTHTVDYQTIRVQEIVDDDIRESGRIPRTIECELTEDLVDACVPGDIIVATGEIKVVSSDSGPGKVKKTEHTMFLLYMSTNCVVGPRQRAKAARATERAAGTNESPEDAIEFTMGDLYAIQCIQAEPAIFHLLVNSLCPTIYGHEMVKAGLLLSLFGGCQKYASDANRVPIRGDPHLLIVGDPGLGKSQMLQAVAAIAPRGVYVCGNTTSTAGLTVTLHKEPGSGDYALEAGALVLGDQGCCCIDEFDKMGQQHQALLEAMEQQCISIAKAGICCNLPARTSILAAANPVGGHYNKAKTVSENLRMNAALLSRFDLVFILVDKVDETMDRLLSAHVMSLHNAHAAGSSSQPPKAPQPIGVRQAPADPNSLAARLQPIVGASFEPVPHAITRKYVSYARKYVHPKMRPEAALVLQKFYLELRSKHRGADSTPITTRQIESLIRLAEARARLELREFITVQDAEDVIEIMKTSFFDTFSDEFGMLDFTRSQNGSGMSKKAQAKTFVAELSRQASISYNALFTKSQLRTIASDLQIQVGSFEDFLDSLNNQGYLLKKGPQTFQLQSSA